MYMLFQFLKVVDMCMFVFKFHFIDDKVSEVFDDIPVNIFHESFDGWY